MPLIKAGSFDLEYSDTGSGPAIVLVHSSASGLRQWRRLSDTLANRYRVIAINLFGYGKTTPWPGTRPLAAADQAGLVAAVTALAPGPIALVGHSLGGAVALEAAARLSNQVRVLVAFEPILFGTLEVYGRKAAYEEVENMVGRFTEGAQAGDWNAAGECFVDYWGTSGTWAAMPDDRRQNTIAMLPPVLHEWDMATTGTRPLADWRAITAPVHLIRAADTRAPMHEIVNLLAKAYPHWGMHEVSSGGHMAPLTRPDLVNPLIAAVIDDACHTQE
jgi:pimeloyl-ACP methyl ester carboxylesterase